MKKQVELIVFTILGFMLQQLSYGSGHSSSFFNQYIGFTLFFPLFVLLMYSVHSIFKIKSNTLTTFISLFLALVVHVANFLIYPALNAGRTEQMYGLILVYGIPPTIIVGLIYSFYFIKSKY